MHVIRSKSWHQQATHIVAFKFMHEDIYMPIVLRRLGAVLNHIVTLIHHFVSKIFGVVVGVWFFKSIQHSAFSIQHEVKNNKKKNRWRKGKASSQKKYSTKKVWCMCYVCCAWVRVSVWCVCWGFCCVGEKGKKKREKSVWVVGCWLDSGGDRIYLI